MKVLFCLNCLATSDPVSGTTGQSKLQVVDAGVLMRFPLIEREGEISNSFISGDEMDGILNGRISA